MHNHSDIFVIVDNLGKKYMYAFVKADNFDNTILKHNQDYGIPWEFVNHIGLS